MNKISLHQNKESMGDLVTLQRPIYKLNSSFQVEYKQKSEHRNSLLMAIN